MEKRFFGMKVCHLVSKSETFFSLYPIVVFQILSIQDIVKTSFLHVDDATGGVGAT